MTASLNKRYHKEHCKIAPYSSKKELVLYTMQMHFRYADCIISTDLHV